MMPLCAADGAQFVRSFSSSLSTEKPQCCGKHEIVRSVPLPPLGEACHPCLVAPPQCQACATGQGVALQPPVQDMPHQLATHGSAATLPIIVAEISSLGTRGPTAVRGVRFRATRAAATRSGVPGQARHCHQPGKACRRSRREEPADAAMGRGVPSMHPGKACCRHRATRGAAANAALVCPTVSLPAHSLSARFLATARPSVSRLV